MGRKKFSSIVIIFMLVPLFSTILTVTQAADVEGVSITSDSIAITPENPIAGTPISIKSTLNNSNTEVTEVDVYFYKNTYESGNPWKIQHLSLDASDGIRGIKTGSIYYVEAEDDANIEQFVKEYLINDQLDEYEIIVDKSVNLKTDGYTYYT